MICNYINEMVKYECYQGANHYEEKDVNDDDNDGDNDIDDYENGDDDVDTYDDGDDEN